MSVDINDHSGTDRTKRLNFGAEVDTKHPAEVLADDLDRLYDQLDPVDDWRPAISDSGNMLRTIPALEAERGKLQQDWNRFHHLMKKHGLHPGRTDDDLLEILDRDMEASKAGLHHLRANNVEVRDERDKLRAEVEALRVAAKAVIDRWDSPAWKDLPHIGEYISRLRDAARGAT